MQLMKLGRGALLQSQREAPPADRRREPARTIVTELLPVAAVVLPDVIRVVLCAGTMAASGQLGIDG